MAPASRSVGSPSGISPASLRATIWAWFGGVGGMRARIVVDERVLARAQHRDPRSITSARVAAIGRPSKGAGSLVWPGQDERLGRQRGQALQRRMQQPRPFARLLGTRLQIGPADAGEEERVAGEERSLVQEVATCSPACGRACAARRAARSRSRAVSPSRIGSEGIRHPILLGQVERRPGLLGQQAGAAEVIGVDVGIQDVGDGPAVLGREVLIDLGRQGRIDDDGLTVVADQVGEAALAGAADLDDGRRAARARAPRRCSRPGSRPSCRRRASARRSRARAAAPWR